MSRERATRRVATTYTSCENGDHQAMHGHRANRNTRQAWSSSTSIAGAFAGAGAAAACFAHEPVFARLEAAVWVRSLFNQNQVLLHAFVCVLMLYAVLLLAQ